MLLFNKFNKVNIEYTYYINYYKSSFYRLNFYNIILMKKNYY